MTLTPKVGDRVFVNNLGPALWRGTTGILQPPHANAAYDFRVVTDNAPEAFCVMDCEVTVIESAPAPEAEPESAPLADGFYKDSDGDLVQVLNCALHILYCPLGVLTEDHDLSDTEGLHRLLPVVPPPPALPTEYGLYTDCEGDVWKHTPDGWGLWSAYAETWNTSSPDPIAYIPLTPMEAAE